MLMDDIFRLPDRNNPIQLAASIATRIISPLVSRSKLSALNTELSTQLNAVTHFDARIHLPYYVFHIYGR